MITTKPDMYYSKFLKLSQFLISFWWADVIPTGDEFSQLFKG